MRYAALAVLTVAAATLLLTGGCARPWSHPDYTGKAAERQFDKDSTSCKAISGEAFPLSELKQKERYDMCMKDRGWVYSEGAISFDKKR